MKNLIWEPFNESDSKYLHITKLLKIKNKPLGDRKQFWDDLLEKYSNEAVDGVIVGDEEEEEEEVEVSTKESKTEEEIVEDFVAQNAPKEEGVDDVLFVNQTHEEL